MANDDVRTSAQTTAQTTAQTIFRGPWPDIEIPVTPLPQFVLERAAQFPNRPALVDGPTGRTITYRQLEEGVRRMAVGLSRRGFGKGDVLAIYSPNLPEYALAFQGTAFAGGTVTTANPLATADELAKQLNDSGAVFLVTIPQILDRAREAAAKSGVREVFVFGEAEGATPFAALLAEDGSPPEVAIDPDADVVVLPYSSGTTGLPKGVMLTHRNLVANLCQMEASLPLDDDETLIAILPFFHIYGMVCIMSGALRSGATVVTLPRFDLEQFLQTLQDYRVTRAYLVPPIILALAKHPIVDRYDLSSLRSINSGAAPLGSDIAEACAARLGCIVKQGYGLTETSPVTHVSPDELNKPGKVGPGIPNTEYKVIDVITGDALGPDQEGELCIRGPQVMLGYLHQPEATAFTIDADGWLHTGDVAIVDSDGYVAIVDRIKELIKYKGFQVAPAELEALIAARPDVADVAVIGSPDAEAGEIPKAFVVPRGEISSEEILAYVAERVAPHKRIRLLEIVDQIPRASSGKILRRVLVEQERARISAR